MKLIMFYLIAAAWATPMAAQQAVTVIPAGSASELEHPHRDPQRARVLGTIFPGAGHIYAGEYLRGYLIYLRTVVGIGGGVMTFVIAECPFTLLGDRPCTADLKWPYRLLGIASVGAGVWSWISGARDAPRAAERANERHRRKMIKVSPVIRPGAGPGAGAQVGVRLQW